VGTDKNVKCFNEPFRFLSALTVVLVNSVRKLKKSG
jgi:hypothetical protein